MAGPDKKLYKQISQEGAVDELEALCPINLSSGNPSSFSLDRMDSSDNEEILCASCSRKTLYFLKSTLNTAYSPDYDFSSTKSHEFSREPSYIFVARAINSFLFGALGDTYTQASPTLWQSIATEINSEECDIYSYNPDLESDPFGQEGSLWSFNYFFYNKKLRRIVFFTCRALSMSAPFQDEEMMDEAADDEDDAFNYEDE